MGNHNFAHMKVGKQKDEEVLRDATDKEHDTEEGPGGDATDREEGPGRDTIDTEEEPGGDISNTEGPGEE